MMLKVFEEFIKNDDIDPFGEEDWYNGNYKEIFIQFLKDNGAYDKFVENLNNQKTSINIEDYLNDMEDDSKEYLIRSFLFGETKEGQNYWHRLNYRWLKKFN